MLPTQAVNVCEAALGRPPPSSVFLAGIKKAIEAPPQSTVDQALFGETFVDPIPKAPGSEKNQKGAFNAMNNFQKVLEKQGVVIEDLDAFMVAFAKWTLTVESMFDDKNQQIVAKAQRDALCKAAGVPMYEWSPQTLTTYTNALGVLYARSRQGQVKGLLISLTGSQL